MSFEAFEHYLSDDSRRGPAPDGAFSGAAGGAPCGDLVRVSLAVERGRVVAARFDAEGCAAAIAAGAAVAERPRAPSVLEAARIGPAEVSAELGGLSPQGRHAAELAADALHRALGAAASSGEAPRGPAGERRPRAGGDERRRRLRRRGAARAPARRRGGRGDPEAVGRPAHRRGAKLLLAGGGRRRPGAGPRARAAAPDARPRGRVSRHRRRRASCAATRRGGRPNPCVVCNGEVRIDAMLALARRVGASGARHRPLRSRRRRRRGAAAGRAGRRGQGPDLHALRAAAGVARRASLPARRPDQAPGARAGRRRRPAGRRQAREPGPLLPRRRGQALLPRPARAPRASGRARSSTARAGSSGATAGHHNFTVGQRRGLGVAAGEPLYVLATDAAANRVVVGPREALATQRVQVRDAVLLRDGERVDRVKLRYRSRPIGCAVEGAAGRHPELCAGAGRAGLRRRARARPPA